MYCTFEQKETLEDIFALVKDVDQQIFSVIIEMFLKEKIQDCIGYLSDIVNNRHFDQFLFQGENLTQVDKEQKRQFISNNIKRILNVLKKIKDHDFNQIDYSTEGNQESKQDLIKRIRDERTIIEFLKFLVHLTSFDNTLIQCGSNSLNILIEMKVDIRNQMFQNIKIQNTSLEGANFVGCNLNGSLFDNVDISGINLTLTQLFNCKWNNLRIHELNQLDGHNESVRSVCFSPDGTTLASGSEDKSIRLWDVETGQQKSKLDGHTSYVRSVCFSHDGTTLASGGGSFLDNDNSISLWDMKTRKKKARLDGHSSWVNSVCFSPDGTALASCSDDKSTRLWNVKTGQQKFKLDGHRYGVNSVCFSPDGTTLASGSDDKSILLWNVETGQFKSKLDGHRDSVQSVCFSPDGTTIASGSLDNSIGLWDVKTEQQESKLDGHTNRIYQACFSPDGTTLAACSDDNSICLWDIKTRQQKSKLEGHTSIVYSVCFSPDSTTLASGSHDNSIRFWDGKIRKKIQTYNNNYKNIHPQFKAALFFQNSFSDCVHPVVTTNVISPFLNFQAYAASILRGEFINHQGKNLQYLFKQRGGCFLQNQQVIPQNTIKR